MENRKVIILQTMYPSDYRPTAA